MKQEKKQLKSWISVGKEVRRCLGFCFVLFSAMGIQNTKHSNFCLNKKCSVFKQMAKKKKKKRAEFTVFSNVALIRV